MNIVQVPSPNFAQGRDGYNVQKIIIHYMAGDLAAADVTFSNSVKQTSAHYGIENDIVHQYVDEGDTAFHAGNLIVNYESIGIEHSATLTRPPSDATYETSIELSTVLCKKYNLTEEDIYPHSSVVPTQCPGTVDVDRIKQGVSANLKGEDMQPAPYEVANIYAQTILLRDMSRDEWEKYHKDKTRNQLFDDFRIAPERSKRLQLYVDSVSALKALQSAPGEQLKQKVDAAKQLADQADQAIQQLKETLQ